MDYRGLSDLLLLDLSEKKGMSWMQVDVAAFGGTTQSGVELSAAALGR